MMRETIYLNDYRLTCNYQNNEIEIEFSELMSLNVYKNTYFSD